MTFFLPLYSPTVTNTVVMKVSRALSNHIVTFSDASVFPELYRRFGTVSSVIFNDRRRRIYVCSRFAIRALFIVDDITNNGVLTVFSTTFWAFARHLHSDTDPLRPYLELGQFRSFLGNDWPPRHDTTGDIVLNR